MVDKVFTDANILLTDVFNLYNRGERLMIETIRNHVDANYGFLSFYAIVDGDYLEKSDIALIGNKKLRSFMDIIPMLALNYASAVIYHWIGKTWFLTDLLKEIKSYDLAIDLGGETFQDTFSLLGVLKHLYTLKLLSLMRIRYAIISHTMVFKNPLVWLLAKPVIRNASALTVRGQNSFDFMQKKGIQCEFHPDIVFAYNELHSRKKNKPMKIGINASPLVKENISKYVELVISLAREGHEILLIPHVLRDAGRDDRKVLYEIWKHLPTVTRKRTRLYTHRSFNVVKYLMDRCDLWIGSRMHSAIYTLGTGIPTIIIGYNEKNQYLEQLLGENVQIVKMDNPRFLSSIISKVRDIDQNYDRYLKDLEQTIRPIKEGAEGHLEVLQSLLSE